MSEKRRPPRPFELDPATAGIVAEAEPKPIERAAEAEPVEPAPSSRRWLVGLLGGGLLGLLLLQAVVYVRGLVAESPWLGWPFALLLAVVAGSTSVLVGRELAELSRLTRRARLREAAARLVGSELHGEAPKLLDAVGRELAPASAARAELARFHDRASDALADGERLVLFERTVLAPLDRRAYRLVLESARDIGLLTALSPVGLLDGLVVLWRTTFLLRAIARLYGMAPGPAASLALFRRCLRNAALAGIADVVSQATLEHAGASILSILSARAGQGAGNALLAAKLGLEAIRETRPLPFVVEEPPRLARLREALGEARPTS
ncbi:MAG: TIGR01620 family protein [Geminicoccaceae bacterium]|nr:TIGR01620 family protein [Geminicoccaceae bacterium]